MADLMELKDEIKATVTMADLVDRLGLGPSRRGKIRSIYKDEKTPSLHVYKYDYFDFATGQGGDQIRFVMDVRNCTFRDAISWISHGADELAPRRKAKEEREREVHDLTAVFNTVPGEIPTSRVMGLLKDIVQGKWPTLTLADIIRYGSRVTYGGTLWTPHYDGMNRVVGIKIRDLINMKKRAVKGSTFRERLYQPVTKPIPVRTSYAWILEGESDAWAMQKHLDTCMWPELATVYALPSGAGLWRDQWRTVLHDYRNVYIATDPDDAGNEAAERIRSSLKSVAIHSYRVEVPGKDVADSIANGWLPHGS